MTDLTNLISAAVAEKMTPEFITKEIDIRVEKLVIESVDRALRSYSDTGKLIEKAVEDALRVNRLDLPSYGTTVTKILKTQIETCVAELVAGRLSRDMEELLSLAPKEIKLSEIADQMREQHNHDAYGEIITVIVDDNDYKARWVYFDDENGELDKYKCKFSMLVSDDGTISAARMDGKNLTETRWIGRAYGFEQKLRAYVACGTKVILDEDAVVTSVGDY